jgi:PST family polysaccharide transporter
MALGILNASLDSLVMVTGKTRRLFERSLVNFAVRMPVMILGLSTLGMMGVIYARVFSGLANTAINLQLAKRVTGLWWGAPVIASWRTLLSCFIMVAVVAIAGETLPSSLEFAAASYSLAWKAAVGGTVYVLSHVSLWLLSGRPEGLESLVLCKVLDKLGELVNLSKE